MNTVNANTLRLICDNSTSPEAIVRLAEINNFFFNVVSSSLQYRAFSDIQRIRVIDEYDTLIDMCLKESDSAVKWLIDTYNITKEKLNDRGIDVLKYACHNDNISQFRCVCEKLSICTEDIRSTGFSCLKYCSLRGYVKVLRYILETFQISRADIEMNNCRALRWAHNNEIFTLLHSYL